MGGRILRTVAIDEFIAPTLIRLIEAETERLKDRQDGHRDRLERMEWARVVEKRAALRSILRSLEDELEWIGPPTPETLGALRQDLLRNAGGVPRSKANAIQWRQDKAIQAAEREKRRRTLDRRRRAAPVSILNSDN